MKKCPYCAEQIQDEAIKCRYCGSMLTAGPPPPSFSANPSLEAEVRGLLAARQKIEAIKLVRIRTHSSLLAAKNYVEALEAGTSPIMPSVSSLQVDQPNSRRPILLLIALGAGIAVGFYFYLTAHPG